MAKPIGNLGVNAPVLCPLCATEGWPSAIRVGAYAGICGSMWGDDIEPRPAPACQVITELRVELALAQTGMAA